MKKIIFLLIACNSFAQSKFIEVEVKDTISLKPKSFEYIISVNSPSEVFGLDEETDEKNETKSSIAQKTEDIKKILRKEKFEFKSVGEDSFEIKAASFLTPADGIVITLQSIGELKRLKKAIEKLDYITATVGEVIYAEEDKNEQVLIGKLIVKAKTEANLIAMSSGMKLGGIIEVKEVKAAEYLNFQDFFSGLERRFKNMGTHGNDLTGTTTKAFVVKFSAQ